MSLLHPHLAHRLVKKALLFSGTETVCMGSEGQHLPCHGDAREYQLKIFAWKARKEICLMESERLRKDARAPE